MVLVTALACPVCGAPLTSRSETCSFCGSFLLIHINTLDFNRANLKQTVVREQIAAFRDRLRVDSLDVEARYGLGIAYFNLGLIVEASEELEAAARLLPEEAEIRAQAAVVFRERLVQGDPAILGRLKARVDAATALDPDN